MRRQFELLPEDKEHLDSHGYQWETVLDNGSNWLLLHGFPIPAGYIQGTSIAALLIPPTYPDSQIDMVFFNPSIHRKDHKTIPQTQATATICGASYQRWSRHRTAENPWEPGVDNIERHLYLVQHWLRREFKDITP